MPPAMAASVAAQGTATQTSCLTYRAETVAKHEGSTQLVVFLTIISNKTQNVTVRASLMPLRYRQAILY